MFPYMYPIRHVMLDKYMLYGFLPCIHKIQNAILYNIRYIQFIRASDILTIESAISLNQVNFVFAQLEYKGLVTPEYDMG